MLASVSSGPLRRGISENNRRARFYVLTRAGHKELERQEAAWRRLADAIAGVLKHA